ncbi:hypothetical protein [Fastidiosibacter lacustris]|uniref:hypothetical protein n=1 Tax=Fastidiosibacter lacustris TaxID=2056695 RepID=UPI000E34FD7E|nr:hypothetical protein [Fastidiosibacter lacustris]
MQSNNQLATPALVKSVRKKFGLNQTQLEVILLGHDRSKGRHVNRWENGKMNLSYLAEQILLYLHNNDRALDDDFIKILFKNI